MLKYIKVPMQSTLAILLFSLLSLLLGRDEAEIVFAGDAMMHQGQIDAARHSNGTYDFSEYFSVIAPYVISADYAVVNLETPIAGAPYSGYPCFNAPATYLDALSAAGFDLFLTANNHTLDRGDRGLCATIDSLDARQLDHLGTYKSPTERAKSLPKIKVINNIRVGFLNYTYGTNGISPHGNVVVDYINRDVMKRDVEALRKAGAEIIFACVHWGIEYQLLQHQSQTSLAGYLHSLGVECVIGGHPHVVQPIHLKDNKLTVYSLGNFISNMKTTDTRGGAMLRVTISRQADGSISVDNASYRLVYTVPAGNGRNFRLVWPDAANDTRAAAFARSARALFGKHNTNVAEDKPLLLQLINK